METHHSHHDVTVDKTDDESNVIVAKATAMVVLFLASMTMGLIPLKLSKWFKWTQTTDVKSNTFVSLLLSFGGGVLLCTTFQHLLPEVNEGIEDLQADGHLPELGFHLGEFLMCAGFFIIFLVEELVHIYLHSREKRQGSELENVFRRSLSVRRGEKVQAEFATTISTSDLIKTQSNSTLNEVTIKAPTECASKGHDHSHMILPMDDSEDPVVTSIRGLLVVLALSVHELFEGLAVGLETSTSKVWYMFGAVAAHKLVIAFCVGVELVATKTRLLLTFLYVFSFAVVSPLGIGIGIGISASGGHHVGSDITSVILQGMATGTLLYVVFFEVLQRERAGFKQYCAILIGFFIMFGLLFLTGHNHDHDDADSIDTTTSATTQILDHHHHHHH